MRAVLFPLAMLPLTAVADGLDGTAISCESKTPAKACVAAAAYDGIALLSNPVAIGNDLHFVGFRKSDDGSVRAFHMRTALNSIKAFRVYHETSPKIETRTLYRLITAFRDKLVSQVYPETL
ncbi:hypothetical protein [Halovulum sp. GXIMD14793]